MSTRDVLTSAALADLTRDIAGDLPDGLVAAWEDPGRRTSELARALLEPFAREGFVVCTDTSGLSRMATTLPLPRVLKAIREPKQHVHALGSGLGGRAIGTWVADNTEMLYPIDVDLDALLAGMIRLHELGLVGIGFCLHEGTFYEVGGGLHGPDADLVEVLAEVHTSGGDSLLTPPVLARIDPTAFPTTAIEIPGIGTAWSATTQLPAPPLLGTTTYPQPFDDRMGALLDALGPDDDLAPIDAAYRREATVVLAHRVRRPGAEPLVQTIEDLVADRRFQQLAIDTLRAATPWWNVGGGLALAAFDDGAAAVEAAQTIRATCRAAGLQTSSGVTAGPVYRFPMPGGRTELAGDPVNRASKLAEDLGIPGALRIARSVLADGPPGSRPASYRISGIALDVWES